MIIHALIPEPHERTIAKAIAAMERNTDMAKTIPANPSAPKPDLGPMKRPPIGMKPQAKAGNGGKGKPGKRAA